ncbi:13228_t:CDS:2 [Dentiscutata erythropus]|uniref:13228_t:CDS:1 n=1 Tax=Dentiscutata erythropus TaxID=1348616 RepID=A0A9N9GGE9_9GLOM|nr:13228_t:CDS:2 [Dentiscutata erythropus]
MSSKKRSRLACIECRMTKRKCEYNPSYKCCKRCMKCHLSCTSPPAKKKQKHDSFSLVHETSESSNISSEYRISGKRLSYESTQSTEKDNPRLSNTCSCCRRNKKKCEYNGIPGTFRCARCRAKKIQCLFHCIECHEGSGLDKAMHPCVNCKATMEDPPVDYNFVEENNKIYLKLENHDIKIEITQEKFKDLLKLQKFEHTSPPSPDHSFVIDNPYNNNISSIRPDICPSAPHLSDDSATSNICIQPIILQGSLFTESDVYQQTVNVDQFLLDGDLSLYYDLINPNYLV